MSLSLLDDTSRTRDEGNLATYDACKLATERCFCWIEDPGKYSKSRDTSETYGLSESGTKTGLRAMTSPFPAQHSIPIKESKTLKLSGIFTSTDRKYFHNYSVCATLRAHVTNLYLTNKSLRSSVKPFWYQTLFLFSHAFA